MGMYAYITKRFNRSSQQLIAIANDIITEYQGAGYTLTIRQLYYQLVARDHIANNIKEYKRVASLFNDARLAGEMDWDAIEDRTREFIRRSRWSSGRSVLQSAADSFHMDMWENQNSRVFVIVEKEALVGVFERVCRKYDVPLLAARGYPSVSVVREFVEEDMLPAVHDEKCIVILHFGDHDPSGIDMSRDLQTRFDLFLEGYASEYEFERCALNMDQIRRQKPPENPAKTTDSRFDSYRRKFGASSWELDALTPSYLSDLVEQKIHANLDIDEWDKRKAQIEGIRTRIQKLATNFKDAV